MRLAQPQINVYGQLKFIFNSDLLGLLFVEKMGVEMKTSGHISHLFADEKGPVKIMKKEQKVGMKEAVMESEGRRLVDEPEMIFNLNEVVAFELRRGDEDSADAEYLSFNVGVEKLVSDELVMKLDFDHPEKVSTGSQPDFVICEIRDAYFFSQVNGPETFASG